MVFQDCVLIISDDSRISNDQVTNSLNLVQNELIYCAKQILQN